MRSHCSLPSIYAPIRGLLRTPQSPLLLEVTRSIGEFSSAEGASLNRILLVDDDDDNLTMVAHGLRKIGFHVECAKDGEDGWLALLTGDFDAIITDNNMPRLTGIELIRRIRAFPLSLPVILMSSCLPTGEMGLSGLLSPGGAIEKSLSFNELVTQIVCLLKSITN